MIDLINMHLNLHENVNHMYNLAIIIYPITFKEIVIQQQRGEMLADRSIEKKHVI